MQPHTFDISKLPSTPPRIPSHPLGGGLGAQSRPNPLPASRLSQPTPPSSQEAEEGRARPDVFERLFKKNFRTGKQTVMQTFGGWLAVPRTRGLRSQMYALKRSRSGKGMNLSNKDIELISEKIGNTLKKLPTYMAYDGRVGHIPLLQRKRLMGELWNEVKKGTIAHADFADAKRIIDTIEV